MRFETEFNFALKIREAQGLPQQLEVGKKYFFQKTIARIYPLGIPIQLTDDDYQVLAKVVIHDYKAGAGMTEGTYEVLEIYGEDERRFLTADLLKSVKWMEQNKKNA